MYGSLGLVAPKSHTFCAPHGGAVAPQRRKIRYRPEAKPRGDFVRPMRAAIPTFFSSASERRAAPQRGPATFSTREQRAAEQTQPRTARGAAPAKRQRRKPGQAAGRKGRAPTARPPAQPRGAAERAGGALRRPRRARAARARPGAQPPRTEAPRQDGGRPGARAGGPAGRSPPAPIGQGPARHRWKPEHRRAGPQPDARLCRAGRAETAGRGGTF